MSSTLIVRRTPKPPKNKEWGFKQPLKGIIARKFFDHDGSLGGGEITIGPEHLQWFEGVLAAGANSEKGELADLEAIVQILRDGDTIDMWFEN